MAQDHHEPPLNPKSTSPLTPPGLGMNGDGWGWMGLNGDGWGWMGIDMDRS